MNYTTEEFLKMSKADRLQFCRELAERARAMAAHSSFNPEEHEQIAEHWEKLSAQIEREAQQS